MKKSQEMLADVFGQNVFSDKIMRMRLPQNVYRALHRTIDEGAELDPAIAEVIASAMKEWAVERGATHFTHWFQPMNGHTAEKQDAFLSRRTTACVTAWSSPGKALDPRRGGRFVLSLRAACARRLRPAATRLGIRTAPRLHPRGSNGIVSLCIPTAFCSYAGEALDTRTPLLRCAGGAQPPGGARAALPGQTRVARRVKAKVGLEQEYFLIDRDALRVAGHDLDLHWTHALRRAPAQGAGDGGPVFRRASDSARVGVHGASSDEELWKTGRSRPSTEHNEVAPGAARGAPVLFDQRQRPRATRTS